MLLAGMPPNGPGNFASKVRKPKSEARKLRRAENLWCGGSTRTADRVCLRAAAPSRCRGFFLGLAGLHHLLEAAAKNPSFEVEPRDRLLRLIDAAPMGGA